MDIIKNPKSFYLKTCTPAKLYMILSLISILGILVQNLTDSRKYCVGTQTCNLSFPNLFIFLFKLAYVLIWTIILDSLCKNKYTTLAWAFVLLPILLMFVLIGILFIM